MSKKLTCFVIGPIGESGSQIRQDSDDLLELIIKPTLEVFEIEVVRGDHRNESGQIDVDVIKMVQESDLCIVDLSLENVNVYYELGRRDETGKPIILLKSNSSNNLPIDIATRRYIEFNLDDRRAIIITMQKIKEAVQAFVDSGMEKTKGTSLYAISEKIDRIERHLARLSEATSTNPFAIEASGEWENEDPYTLLQVALIEKDIPKAEYAMSKLQYLFQNEYDFYDYIVEQVAIIGSAKAGEMMINYAETFIDSSEDVTKMIEYLGSIVTYLSKSNQEPKYINFVENIAFRIKDENGATPGQVYNQLNRIHHGSYLLTKNCDNLNSAITYLKKAIECEPTVASYYYNLSMCYRSFFEKSETPDISYLELACENINKALLLDGDEFDEDHVTLAIRLYHKVENPLWIEYFEKLKMHSPNKAKLIKRELH